MTDYTKTTDFTSKDSLPSGDSGKIIRGAEFGTEFDNIQTAVNSKSNKENPSFTGNITVTGTVDGRDISADGTKLDTIETSADVTDTANVTAAGAVMDSELTDITAVKALNQGVATTDSPTFAAVTSTGNVTVGGTVDGRDVATDGTKLDTVETNADVTDTTNVTAAGALMDSEVTNLDQVKAFDSADYATAAQGTTADNALPKTGGAMTGAITTNSTFDGRDVATDGTKLDGIEALADVTDTANVTAAGALMDSELTDLTAVKSLDQGVATTDSPTFAGLTTTADMTFGDNDKAIFGAGSDLQLYHDGSNSYVQDAGDGALILNTTNGGGVYVYSAGETMATFNSNGAVNLYYDNAAKLATTSTGIDVTGTATMDGLTVSSTTPVIDVLANTNEDASLRLRENGTGIVGAEFTYDGGDNALYLKVGNNTDTKRLSVSRDTGDISFYEDTGTTAKFFWDASAESLGIGTSSPQASIHTEGDVIIGTATHGASYEGVLQIADGAVNGRTAVLIYNNHPDQFMKLGQDVNTAFIGRDNADEFAIGLFDNASDTTLDKQFVIDASGNVGIGTDSPATLLELSANNNGGASNNTLRFTDTDTVTEAGQQIGKIEFKSNDASGDGALVRGFINCISEDASPSSAITFATNAGGAGVATEEAMRIDSSGNVGIGSSSPDTHLHVQGSSGEIRVQDTGSGGGIVSFRDSGTSSIPSIQSSGNNLLVNTGGSERMRIDSSGNLLVGKTSAGSNNVGAELRPQGYIFGTGDGINPLRLNRQTSDGMIADFQKDGTTVGSIGTASSRVYIGTDDTGLRFTNDEITPFNPSVSADRNGTVDLGGSSTRFKDLYLSGGAYLGGTGSANKLDDYEEGTFTATLKGSTGEPGTLITTTGYYTKIGRDVTYNISFENVNTTGYSGSVSVSGLPFANGFGRHTAAAGVYSLASWTDFVIGVSGQATTTIDLMDIRSGNLWASAQHSAGTTRYLWLSGTYMTTA